MDFLDIILLKNLIGRTIVRMVKLVVEKNERDKVESVVVGVIS